MTAPSRPLWHSRAVDIALVLAFIAGAVLATAALLAAVKAGARDDRPCTSLPARCVERTPFPGGG